MLMLPVGKLQVYPTQGFLIHGIAPPNRKPPSACEVFTKVWNESKTPQQAFLSRLSFFQQRFRIGWGAARVAVT